MNANARTFVPKPKKREAHQQINLPDQLDLIDAFTSCDLTPDFEPEPAALAPEETTSGGTWTDQGDPGYGSFDSSSYDHPLSARGYSDFIPAGHSGVGAGMGPDQHPTFHLPYHHHYQQANHHHLATSAAAAPPSALGMGSARGMGMGTNVGLGMGGSAASGSVSARGASMAAGGQQGEAGMMAPPAQKPALPGVSAEDMQVLQQEFPEFGAESLAEILEANDYNVQITIDVLTQLELAQEGDFDYAHPHRHTPELSFQVAPALNDINFPSLSSADDKKKPPGGGGRGRNKKNKRLT